MVRVRYELDVRCPVVLTRDGERVYQYDRGPRAADKSQELFNRVRMNIPSYRPRRYSVDPEGVVGNIHTNGLGFISRSFA